MTPTARTSFVAICAVLCLISSPVSGTSCSAQWQCSSVSTDYNYVLCQSGECACRTDLGFTGSATAEDPCKCDAEVYWGQGNPHCKSCEAPRTIIYGGNGIPYCVNPVECEAQNAAKDRAERQKAVVRRLYEDLIWPRPLPIVLTLEVDGIFTEDVKGRVTPAGTFEGIEGSIEYFFALAAAGQDVTDIKFIDLISEGNEVAVRVDIFFNSTTGDRGNLTETGVFTFNDEGLIYTYDLAILRLGKARNEPEFTHPFTIQFLCANIMQYCPAGGPTEEYQDYDTCVSFMESIAFGSWDDAQTNSVICRLLHSILIPIRPEIHCPHVGPLGGGKCQEFAYSDFYQTDY